MSFEPGILLAGLCAGLSAVLFGTVFVRAVLAVPPEDRSWLDRPPAFIRMLWWPSRVLGFWIGSLLPMRWREHLLLRMRLAGLDYVLTPAQLLAHRIVLALVGAALGLALAQGWNTQRILVPAALGAGLALLLAQAWFADRIAARRRLRLKTLPFFLDLITLCVEAGLNLTGALHQAVAKGPQGPLRDDLQRVLRDVRAGKSRADALRTLADRLQEPAISHLVSAIIQAENMGMNLGPILRAQGEQRRNERFARAEKAAMEAPVKLLLPLIGFIFPCTFLVIGFPVVVQFLQMGL